MAVVICQFLKDSFLADLQEAKEELPLRRHFQDVAKVVENKIIGPSSTEAMTNPLYDLRRSLAECILWAEEEQERKSQNKIVHFDAWRVKRFWFLHQTGKKLIRIKKDLTRLSNDAADKTFSLSDAIRICSVWDSSWLSGEEEPRVYGLEDKLQSIKTSLRETSDDAVKAIAIVGMGGVGKTTLARKFVDCEASNNFSPIIWVRITEETTPSQIVVNLLGTLRGFYGANDLQMYMEMTDLNKYSPVNDARPYPEHLREIHSLLWGEKYLIVLDDVCYLDEWYFNLGSQTLATPSFKHLSDCLPMGSGGAIVVTTRFQEIGRSMVGEKNLLKLEPTYGADELWFMFEDSIKRKKFSGPDEHQTLPGTKKDIIDRCDGLPLAAKTLAEAISFRIIKERYWSDSTATKTVFLRIDVPDGISFSNIIEKASTYPGVESITRSTRNGEIEVDCKCDVWQLVGEFGKWCHAELINVTEKFVES